MTPQRDIQAEAALNKASVAQAGTSLDTGTVKALVTEREAMVTLANGNQIHAFQATSCLLAPVIGDTVLVFQGPEQAFVLSVLAREADVTAELGVAGARDVALKAEGHLALAAPDVQVSARRMTVLADTLMQTGKKLVSNFSRTLETYVDKMVNARTITTTAQSRSSAIKETETLKAGILVQNIDTVATQNSEISMITAEEDVRLDGKRVSVG
ncbi:DUF3540 domain-containing protein [Roseibium sediminicola]|uniref:DUF3540 domain-containing protein n=1 Tax=Roseibium sediminicola TaxID=2933272 RepID=A0ABT0GXG0_9HYPH|nr:DUF3540 domain-containing protein [Roseibium sp. CAU 1639]MCK7613495.1 DUF3540 domain-containing protein [Roseibium sp. CAU 1639]